MVIGENGLVLGWFFPQHNKSLLLLDVTAVVLVSARCYISSSGAW